MTSKTPKTPKTPEKAPTITELDDAEARLITGGSLGLRGDRNADTLNGGIDPGRIVKKRK